LAEDEWTNEQLDILDELKVGRADKLFAYLLSGATLTAELQEHIEVLISKRGYRFCFGPESVGPGRPTSRKINLANDFEWCFAKELLIGEMGMKAGDAEHHIAKVFATNFTYVTENIRRAKHFIELLENKGHVVARPTIDEFTKKYPELFSDL
jgi:hypothetical protein